MTRTFNGTSSPCPTPPWTDASRRCGRPKWPQGKHRTWPTAPSTGSKGAPDPRPPPLRIEGADHRIRDPSHPPANDPSRGPQPPASASDAGGRRTIPERRALPSTRSAPTAIVWATSPSPADRRGPPNPARPEPSPRETPTSSSSTRRPPSTPPWTSLQGTDSSPSSLKWTPGPHPPSCPGQPSRGTSRRPDSRHRASTSGTTTDPPYKGPAAGFLARIVHGSVAHQDRIHVLQDPAHAVLGKNFLQPLQMVIHCNQRIVRTVQQKPAGYLKDFPVLTATNLGTFPGYQHRIQLSSEAVPHIAHLRSIPFSRRDAVNAEIRQMDAAGIWEPVQTSQWAHGLVTVPKADGGVRITTDLTPLNPFVIPQRYPLPNIKDLYVELAGATVFNPLTTQ